MGSGSLENAKHVVELVLAVAIRRYHDIGSGEVLANVRKGRFERIALSMIIGIPQIYHVGKCGYRVKNRVKLGAAAIVYHHKRLGDLGNLLGVGNKLVRWFVGGNNDD